MTKHKHDRETLVHITEPVTCSLCFKTIPANTLVWQLRTDKHWHRGHCPQGARK